MNTTMNTIEAKEVVLKKNIKSTGNDAFPLFQGKSNGLLQGSRGRNF